MAIEKKYTEQMPFVGTATQKERLEEEAQKRRASVARIIREMVDERYLLDDGEEQDLAGQARQAADIAEAAGARSHALDVQVSTREADESAG